MVEAKVVSIEELQTDNPTLCLSVLRVFNKCFECEQYKKFKKGYIKKMKCKPHIDKDLFNAELLKRKEELLKQIEKINNELMI